MKMWDLYDNNLENTYETIPAKSEVPKGYYHMALELWIINSKKELLLLKNSIDFSRRNPGCWNSLGSSLVSGETYEEAIERIIYNRIGLKIDTTNNIMLDPVKRDPFRYAYVTCIIFTDIELNDIEFKDGNSTEAKFVTKDELLKICENGEFSYYLISRLDEVAKYLDK